MRDTLIKSFASALSPDLMSFVECNDGDEKHAGTTGFSGLKPPASYNTRLFATAAPGDEFIGVDVENEALRSVSVQLNNGR